MGSHRIPKGSRPGELGYTQQGKRCRRCKKDRWWEVRRVCHCGTVMVEPKNRKPRHRWYDYRAAGREPESREPREVRQTGSSVMSILEPMYSEAAAYEANRVWGANCGPNALAFVAGAHIDKVRGRIPGFEEKRYTNPTMMKAGVESFGLKVNPVDVRYITRNDPGNVLKLALDANDMALVRIQWDGPWRNVPRAAYGRTHWIAAWKGGNASNLTVFDVNGGVRLFGDWCVDIVPALTSLYKGATGKFWPTHVWRIEATEQYNNGNLQAITLKDIHTYQTLVGGYRSYIRTNPNIEVWGSTYKGAENLLREKIIKLEIPFDFSELD